MRHYIKKQVVQLLVDPSLDAFGLQQAASNYYWSEIVPVLERIFDELSTDGETIRLDRLELDLGMLTDGLLRTAMKQELYVLLRRQVEDALLRRDRFRELPVLRESGAEHALRQWWYYMEHGRLHWGQSALTPEWHREVLAMLSVDHAAISRLKEEIRKETRLLARICAQHKNDFLETLTGILVAEKQVELGDAVETMVAISPIIAAVAGKDDPGSKKLGVRKRAALQNAIRMWQQRHREYLALPDQGRREAIWRLILRQAAEQPSAFRSGHGIRLLGQWFWGVDTLLLELLRDARVLMPAAPKELLSIPASGRKRSMRTDKVDEEIRPEGPALREKPAERIEDREDDGLKDPTAAAPEISSDRDSGAPPVPHAEGSPIKEEDDPTPVKTRGRKKTGKPADKKKRKEQTIKEGKTRRVQRKGAPDEPGEAPTRAGNEPAHREKTEAASLEEMPTIRATKPDLPNEPLFSEADVDEEGTYIPHAGVILLHPFLPTCFSRLQWWGEGTFADEDARRKAVLLVYYLASGRRKAPEYELVLPKVLCGYSPEAAIPATAALTEEEFAEAEELLQMVLVRWDKLKGTSVEGLREGFLQRGGKLLRRNDRLTLLVERHSIDVLLDFLPWGLSIVKLPWLPEIIYVEWV